MNNSIVLSDDQRQTEQAKRIRAMWRSAGHAGPARPTRMNGGRSLSVKSSLGDLYAGSGVTDLSGDFLGDWRSADSWQRFDMQRVRTRSRQLERGNPWAISFKKSLVNNVLGHTGFSVNPTPFSNRLFGDTGDGEMDKGAQSQIKMVLAEFDSEKNFTTRKKLDRIDADALLLSRLCFDGEIIIRRVPGFENDFRFAWQLIDPDYLDQNLNRVEANGNITRMGIECHPKWKYPVAYWFWRRRPNDFFYNYERNDSDLYTRVAAEDIIHVFMQSEDSEQTRGWPWLFAACVNLFRLGKYEDAALINATIGASKMGFFKKTVPDGFIGDPTKDLDDDSEGVIDEVTPGSWWELPWNVEPVEFNPTYPTEQFDPFQKAMLRSFAACMGASYMGVTGDVSEANFSNMRAGKNEEIEYWKWLQGFCIRKWKKPMHEELIYRAMISRKLPLPISKLDKFKQAEFRGRRWPYVSPLEDNQANELALDMCTTSVSLLIEEQGGNPDVVFQRIKDDNDKMEELGITRMTKGAIAKGSADAQAEIAKQQAENPPVSGPAKERAAGTPPKKK